MQRSRGARLLPLFITGLVIILIIAGIVSVARSVFGPDEATDVSTVEDRGRQQLLDTRDGSSVS